MSDANALFRRFLSECAGEISDLARRRVTLIGSFPSVGPLAVLDVGGRDLSCLSPLGPELLRAAFASSAFESFPAPAVVDVRKACVAWSALGRRADADAIRRALLRGRLRLQGTDGVRGPVNVKVEPGSPESPVFRFGRTGEITPELMYALCFAFGTLARESGFAEAGSKVVLANDSRDAATGWALVRAARHGLSRAGLAVLDLGVAPTPAVPFAQALTGARLGASITASHNPSNQNGIKFFVDRFKMLPEGPLGDFALSAAACDVGAGETPPCDEPVCADAPAILDAFADFIVANLPEGAAGDLASLDLLVDCANGSFADLVQAVFSKLQVGAVRVNSHPEGSNINTGGGVAELEGRDTVSVAETRGTDRFLSMYTLLNRVSRNARPCYAVVLDGDGDRGYLAFSLDGQTAFVVDGDVESFIIVRHMRESGLIPEAGAARFEFVGTVESDLELFRAVRERLGLQTAIGCVGDKWLVKRYREGAPLAIAQEYSGHVLWPAKASADRAAGAEVLSGNGLLTGLYALVAAVRLGLSPAELARPFPRGTFVTRYVYNVNKGLFFPGSDVWSSTLECISTSLDGAPRDGFHSWSVVEMPDEPDMLYVGLQDGKGAVVGAVFVRNSGTENKTCIYARGVKSLEPLLKTLCEALWQLHRRTMKDLDGADFKMETAVLRALTRRPLDREALASAVRTAIAGAFSAPDFDALLYGMRKEGVVSFSGGEFAKAV